MVVTFRSQEQGFENLIIQPVLRLGIVMPADHWSRMVVTRFATVQWPWRSGLISTGTTLYAAVMAIPIRDWLD